jgi:hypothetical protein
MKHTKPGSFLGRQTISQFILHFAPVVMSLADQRKDLSSFLRNFNVSEGEKVASSSIELARKMEDLTRKAQPSVVMKIPFKDGSFPVHFPQDVDNPLSEGAKPIMAARGSSPVWMHGLSVAFKNAVKVDLPTTNRKCKSFCKVCTYIVDLSKAGKNSCRI